MKKKTVAALLAVAMAASMTACADKGEETGTENLAAGYEAPEFSNVENADVSDDISNQSAAKTEGDVSGETDEGQNNTNDEQDNTADRQEEDAEDDRMDTDAENDRADTDETSAGSKSDSETDRADADRDQYRAGSEDTDYEIETVRYDSGLDNVKVTYPQISGWDNEEAQEEWNDIFYESVRDVCKDAGINDSVEIEFEVMTQNDKICSIVMLEHSNWEGAVHPYAYCTTTNIDMETGKKLALNDFADPDELADTLLNTENYSIQMDDMTFEDILFSFGNLSEMPDKERLSQNLAVFDLTYEERIEITEDMMLYGSSFLEDGNVVISIEVNHAMGDYVWVKMQ